MQFFSKKIIISFIILYSSFSNADLQPSKDAIILFAENDSRNIGGPGSDQDYTNGVKLSYIYGHAKIPDWSTSLNKKFNILDNKEKWAQINYGFSIGHQIYTPKNTEISELIKNDRPYAAWLYLGFAVSLKESLIENFFEINIGTIGPSALGQQIQNGFHDLIRCQKANGWGQGLHDEPTLQFFYQKRLKHIISKNLDFISYYGMGLGNVQIGGHLGGMVRLGTTLPDDFGVSRLSAGDGNSFITSPIAQATAKSNDSLKYYVFTSARGSYINRNIFLDGNTFQRSHHIEKKPFIYESEFGFALYSEISSFVWRFVTKSPEFYERKELTSFASISFVYSL